MFRGFEPGAFKKVKLSMKFLFCLCRFDPESFRVAVHDATTELPGGVDNGSNTTSLDKNHVNVTLAHTPLSIRLLHNLTKQRINCRKLNKFF